MSRQNLPTFDKLMNPLLAALKQLGGSGTVNEIADNVVEIAGITSKQLEILHSPEKSSQTEIAYRLGWTRTYLKTYGLLENSSRGVWSLTAKGAEVSKVDPGAVKRFVRNQEKREQKQLALPVEDMESNSETSWRDQLMRVLLEMPPDAFERLSQRFLRESGFIQVEVTGKTGDGGIDGKGILRLGLLSFHVIFQCKRYRGTVSAAQVRDFRGAMVGRADKGLLITTGNFTKDAIREATRDGAPAIDLIDGDFLMDKLKEYAIGVVTEPVTVERVTINRTWFKGV